MHRLMPRMTPLLLLLGCASPEPANCLTTEDLDEWDIAANRFVATTQFLTNACGRRSEVIADLLAGGEVAIWREVPIPAGYARPFIEVDSGADAACALVTVSLGAAAHVGPVASFTTSSGAPTATIRAASAAQRCSVRLRPRLQVGEGPP